MPINGVEWIDKQCYVHAMEHDTKVKISDSNNLYLTDKSQKSFVGQRNNWGNDMYSTIWIKFKHLQDKIIYRFWIHTHVTYQSTYGNDKIKIVITSGHGGRGMAG